MKPQTHNHAWRRPGVVLLISLLFLHSVCSRATGHAETATLKQTGKAFSTVAKRAIPAVVFIKVEKIVSQPTTSTRHFFYTPRGDLFERFFYDPGDQNRGAEPLRQIGQGTGFIISKDGYILTNNHIVEGADKITVKLHDGRTFLAKRVGNDPRSEVAVIKIDGDDFPVLPIGDSDAMEIGEWVIAIGNPFGLSETLTVGVVSAKGRSDIGIVDYEDFIQTDAAINPGNSGGPLLNIEGEVIGINTIIFSQSGGSLGIGFAIPISMAIAIKDQLIKSGKVTRGYMGIAIQDVTQDLAESFGTPQARGILVAEVIRGSAAEKADLKAGDIIVALDGKKVRNSSAFRNRVALTAPGTEMRLMVLRAGKNRTIKIVIGSQTDTVSQAVITSVAEKIGVSVENLSDQWIQRFGYRPGSGVIVTNIRHGSPAHQSGIQRGNLICSINHQPVGTVDEFHAALSSSLEFRAVLLLVKDARYTRFIVIRLD